MTSEAIKIFYSYSRKDLDMRNMLEEHLTPLKRAKRIETWHDLQILAGSEWRVDLEYKLNTADIILLLVSSNFLASDYCYCMELEIAIKRHDAGDAWVIPVILSSCDWDQEYVPFSKLNILPTHAKPITSWQNPSEAYTDIAQNIRKNVDLLIKKKHGIDCINKEKYLDAIKEFEQLISLNSTLFIAYFYRGLAYLKFNQYNEAINDFTYYLNIFPASLDTLINRGDAYYQIGEYELAIVDFEYALNLDSINDIAFNGKRMADKALKKQQEEKERKDAIDAYINQGNTYSVQGEYQLALEKYEAALALDLNSVTAHQGKSATSTALKKQQEEKKKKDAVDTYVNQGNTYSEQGQYRLALEKYEAALTLNPNSVTAHQGKSATSTVLKKQQEEKERRDAVDAYINQGNTYSEQGKYQLALKKYEAALVLAPNNVTAHQEKNAACTALKKQQEEKKDAVDAYINQGNTYSEQGEYQLALEKYEAALALDPTNIISLQLSMIKQQQIQKEQKKQKISKFIKELSQISPSLMPVTIVTGFLGSGKSTFINETLQNKNIYRDDMKALVLLGEFGEESINNDNLIDIFEYIEPDTFCDFCKVNNQDFISKIYEILNRSEQISYLVVETMGLADPVPIALDFLGTELRDMTRLDSVITIIDVCNFSIDLFNSEAAHNQIIYGDIIILNKIDCVDEADVDLLEVRIRDMKNGARIIRSSYGKVPLVLILGLNLFEAEEHCYPDGKFENNLVFFESDRPFSLKKFQDFLDNHLSDTIFRAKGILWFEESKISHVFHLCGKRFSLDDAEWKNQPQTQLLLIGQDLDNEKLVNQLENCLHSESS